MREKLMASVLFFVAVGARAQVAEVARDVSQLHLGPKALVVEGRELAFGGLKLSWKAGSATPVLAGERQVGWFFAGSGEVSYTVQDPLLEPVFAYNVEKATSLSLRGKNAVSQPCEAALVITSGPPEALLSPLPQGEQSPAQEAFSRHRERFSRDLG